MKKNFWITTTLITLLTPPLFAANTSTPSATSAKKACESIGKACQSAGYIQGGSGEGKGVWFDCMKPILGGQTVKGVKVEATDVEACRTILPK